mgnify:CR=1 FL=1
MKRYLVRAIDHGMIASLFASALSLLVVAFPATAQDRAPDRPPPAAVAGDEIDRLVSTLEDDQARARLVEQLRALVEARRQVEAPEPADGLLEGLSTAIGEMGDDVLAAVGNLRDLPRLADWIAGQVADPQARHRWGVMLMHLGLVLGAGALAERVAAFLLARTRRSAAPAEAAPLLVRLPLAAMRALLDIVPVGAFAAAAYGVTTLLGLAGNVRVAAITVITAYAGVRVLVVLARMLAAPRTPTLRLLPVDDETAEYLVIWTRRLAGVCVFGYFIADAARLLGLPRAGFNALLKGIGLAIAGMLVVFILQNRTQVAAAIRRAADRWAWGRRLTAVSGRLADIWHVLAIAYVAAVYGVWAIPIRGGFEYILRATLLTVAILTVAGLVSTALRRLIDRGFAVSQEARDRFPGLETRANRYLPVLHMAFRAVVVAATVLAVMQAWGLETFTWVTSELGRHVLASGITIAAVLLAALVVWELVSGAVERYMAATDGDGNPLERSARARTLLPLARNALMVALVVVVGLIVLSELGVNIAPLLAGAGVIGIAIGFGSQKLVQDVITGAFILFEDTISVGDVVKLDAHAGVVEAMSIRAIRLRDLNGNVHTIPFSAVGTIVNMTKEFSCAVIDVGVAYREDTDHVTDVLKGLDEELRADPEFGPLILEPMEVIGVDRFDASAVVIRVRFKTQPIKQWSVMREFNRRMKRRFDELGIEIPFPQTTVWFGEDRKGHAPPMRLRVEGRKGEAPAAAMPELAER